MPFRRIRYYLEYAIALPFMALLSILPFAVSARLAKRSGDLAYFVMRQRREIALSNLEKVFGHSLSGAQKRNLARRSFENIAVSIIELFLVPKFKKNTKKHFDLTGFDRFEDAFSAGNGALFAISHLGSWELLSFLVFMSGKPVSVVVRLIKNPFFDGKINALRRLMRVDPIRKKNAAKEVLRRLRKNHGIAILIDQWAGGEGIETDFFGHITSTTSIPARLAKKTGAAILPLFCIRKGIGRYEIQILERIPFRADQPNWEKDTTDKLNRLLEQQIRKYPEQWFWGHRRWKPIPSAIPVKTLPK